MISRHIFLKNQVSTVFLVYKNRTHQSSVPHLFSCWREDLPLLQFPAHFCCGKTSLIEAENQPDNLCFILYNDVGFASIKVLPVTIDLRPALLPILKTLSNAPGNVGTDGSGFFLCECSQNRMEHLRIGASGVDIFLFEENCRSKLFQMPYVSDAVKGVPGKPADRLRENPINLSVLHVLDHLLKARTFRCLGPGNSFVRVDPGVLPCGIGSDLLLVHFDLCFKAGLLLIAVRADTAVGCNPQLLFSGSLCRSPCFRPVLRSSDLYTFHAASSSFSA